MGSCKTYSEKYQPSVRFYPGLSPTDVAVWHELRDHCVYADAKTVRRSWHYDLIRTVLGITRNTFVKSVEKLASENLMDIDTSNHNCPIYTTKKPRHSHRYDEARARIEWRAGQMNAHVLFERGAEARRQSKRLKAAWFDTKGGAESMPLHAQTACNGIETVKAIGCPESMASESAGASIADLGAPVDPLHGPSPGYSPDSLSSSGPRENRCACQRATRGRDGRCTACQLPITGHRDACRLSGSSIHLSEPVVDNLRDLLRRPVHPREAEAFMAACNGSRDPERLSAHLLEVNRRTFGGQRVEDLASILPRALARFDAQAAQAEATDARAELIETAEELAASMDPDAVEELRTEAMEAGAGWYLRWCERVLDAAREPSAQAA